MWTVDLKHRSPCEVPNSQDHSKTKNPVLRYVALDKMKRKTRSLDPDPPQKQVIQAKGKNAKKVSRRVYLFSYPLGIVQKVLLLTSLTHFSYRKFNVEFKGVCLVSMR